MDTPRPDQIRRAQPQAEAAAEEDSLELMEMILGALGATPQRRWAQPMHTIASLFPVQLMAERCPAPAVGCLPALLLP